MRMAGGPLAWKNCLWPTVAGSSTEAEYNIPREVATILYEDNDGATAMANTGNHPHQTQDTSISYTTTSYKNGWNAT